MNITLDLILLIPLFVLAIIFFRLERSPRGGGENEGFGEIRSITPLISIPCK